MTIKRSVRVINSNEGPIPQNTRVGAAQFNMEEAQFMMQNMLDQQGC